MYNTNYYKDEKMLQLKPYAEAIHTFKTGDGTIIAIFQGNRGDNPELDFRVKYLNDDPNARPVQLPHVDWVYLANLHTSFLCNLIYPTFSRILLYSC